MWAVSREKIREKNHITTMSWLQQKNMVSNSQNNKFTKVTLTKCDLGTQTRLGIQKLKPEQTDTHTHQKTHTGSMKTLPSCICGR